MDWMEIPEDLKLGDEIFFEVKISDDGIEGKSNIIPVKPMPKIKKSGK